MNAASPDPAARPADRAAVAGPHLAFLANHLTPRDRWLARVVGEHRVFTSAQLARLAFDSVRTANQRLLQLFQWRVLDRFQPLLAVGSAPMHYVLDVAGAAVLAAEDGIEVDQLGYRHDRALAIGHSLRLAHTLGVNGLYAALVATARHSTPAGADTDGGGGGRAVGAWWPETRCARMWGDLARPDAYARWHEDGTEVDFFLEYDTGTEPLAKVAGKLDDYARLAAATAITTPILFWFPSPAREDSARAALAAALAALDHPDATPVATTAADRARTASAAPTLDDPASARWLPLAPGRGSAAGARARLARLPWSHAATDASMGDAAELANAGGPAGVAEPAPMPPAGQPAYNPRPTVRTSQSGDPRRRR